MKVEVLIYKFVKQLPDALNRSERRLVKKEYDMIVNKLGEVASDYQREVLARNSFDDDNTFNHYNERFQKTAIFLSEKVKFHAIHRGWFYLMYKPEKIGVMRDEEKNSNAIANWTMETIARPFF